MDDLSQVVRVASDYQDDFEHVRLQMFEALFCSEINEIPLTKMSPPLIKWYDVTQEHLHESQLYSLVPVSDGLSNYKPAAFFKLQGVFFTTDLFLPSV